MPTQPAPQSPIHTTGQPFRVESEGVSGSVVAIQFSGASTNYLVVRDDGDCPPIWVGESEISGSSIIVPPG